MIIYRVAIRCNGCGKTSNDWLSEVQTMGDAADLAAFVEAFAQKSGWTVQGNAHWCSKCVVPVEKAS